MTNTSKTLVFFGTEEFSLTALTGLIEAGYSIAAVVTKPDSRKGRGQQVVPPSVKVVAERHNIPVLQPQKLGDITEYIQALDHPVGVLVSYGKIIPQSIIDLFEPGIINLHPSLLPLYRGPSPIESAIRNGDDMTGVSIMQLSAKMDAGPVYTAKQHPLKGTETRLELYHTLAVVGTNLLLETLPRIISDDLQPVKQDESRAVYCQLLQKQDAALDPKSVSAQTAERLVRAHAGFPKTKIDIEGTPIIITEAHVSHEKNTPLDILCQDGAFLSVDTLIAPSGRTMDSAAFLRGYIA